ncbi:hypothetical protein J437_LFUL019150 [Ladona fulva]|uniref:Fork-head domain-containing protein n=1 Tax=Ladona fulva TaxID=123851 RepID=A0A8K0KSA6_LADFU|nr:hypothetical protein J437_LFUL019150 [Ladona fulva]
MPIIAGILFYSRSLLYLFADVSLELGDHPYSWFIFSVRVLQHRYPTLRTFLLRKIAWRRSAGVGATHLLPPPAVGGGQSLDQQKGSRLAGGVFVGRACSARLQTVGTQWAGCGRPIPALLLRPLHTPFPPHSRPMFLTNIAACLARAFAIPVPPLLPRRWHAMCSNPGGGPGALSSFPFGDQPQPPADAAPRSQNAPGPATAPDVEADTLAPAFPAIGSPLDHYRLQLYHYAMAERLRYAHPALFSAPQPPHHPYAASVAPGFQTLRPHEFPLAAAYQYGKLDPRLFRVAEEPKPQHSYIGLIAMAILSSSERKLVLSDIYQYILDNYPYFRTRGPGWRNSIRHNLSLNDCFVKAGRSANGKGHYWAIHPANVEDFRKGDFRRRKAQRKVRKHMGLAVDEEDSPSPPPVSPPGWAGTAAQLPPPRQPTSTSLPQRPLARKRQFDVASLLAPDDPARPDPFELPPPPQAHLVAPPGPPCCSDEEDAIDVVSGEERREGPPCILPPPPWVRLPPPTQVPAMLLQSPSSAPPVHRPAPLSSSSAAAEHLGRMYLQSLAQRRSREAAAPVAIPERPPENLLVPKTERTPE